MVFKARSIVDRRPSIYTCAQPNVAVRYMLSSTLDLAVLSDHGTRIERQNFDFDSEVKIYISTESNAYISNTYFTSKMLCRISN